MSTGEQIAILKERGFRESYLRTLTPIQIQKVFLRDRMTLQRESNAALDRLAEFVREEHSMADTCELLYSLLEQTGRSIA